MIEAFKGKEREIETFYVAVIDFHRERIILCRRYTTTSVYSALVAYELIYFFSRDSLLLCLLLLVLKLLLPLHPGLVAPLEQGGGVDVRVGVVFIVRDLKQRGSGYGENLTISAPVPIKARLRFSLHWILDGCLTSLPLP